MTTFRQTLGLAYGTLMVLLLAVGGFGLWINHRDEAFYNDQVVPITQETFSTAQMIALLDQSRPTLDAQRDHAAGAGARWERPGADMPARNDLLAALALEQSKLADLNRTVRESADYHGRIMLAGLGGGLALSIVLLFLQSRLLLHPVRVLTQMVEAPAHGSLDGAASGLPEDEFGALGEKISLLITQLRDARLEPSTRARRAQQITSATLDTLDHAIAAFDPQSNVILSNASAGRLFGLTLGATLHSANLPVLTRIFARVRQSKEGFHPEGFAGAIPRTEKGAVRFFLPHAAPILGDAGEFLGTAVVLADVTELRRLDEAKNDLISTVSHELKTPLTSIQMACHLLLDETIGPITGRQRELLDASCEDATRLTHIIDNLLDMNRIQEGSTTLHLAPLAPSILIADALNPLRPAMADKSLIVQLDIPDPLPAVAVDRGRIRYVLANLLSNAVKYTPASGTITLAVVAEEAMLRFSVRDTGPGIAAPHHQQIFEKFFRVVDSSGAAGVGLGLAIARELVLVHQGDIGVISTPGQGSEFWFTLPRATAS